MASLEIFKSHPDKTLLQHSVDVGVGSGCFGDRFHDVPKINPVFQLNKLKNKVPYSLETEYSNHSYPAAIFYLLCAWYCKDEYKKAFGVSDDKMFEHVLDEFIKILCHHGSLINPDFSSLNEEELNKAIDFLILSHDKLPYREFYKELGFNVDKVIIPPKETIIKIIKYILNHCNQSDNIKDKLSFVENIRYGFSSLISSDKKSAGNYNVDDPDAKRFWQDFKYCLDDYTSKFSKDGELNHLRGEFCEESVKTLEHYLTNTNERVFSLVGPTGCSKTLTLLRCADKIQSIKKIPFKISYSLPFLSIIDQVYGIVRKILSHKRLSNCAIRIDSKADPDAVYEEESDHKSVMEYLSFLKKALEKIGILKKEDKVKTSLNKTYREDTFSYRFIVTTFVRVFESLMFSNRNREIMKLHNFSNTIFLIDEIQALPPRLYGFAVAYLKFFCEKHNCYAIVSTATMPCFDVPDYKMKSVKENPKEMFKDFSTPLQLVNPEKYFSNPVFNRYLVEFLPEEVTFERLADKIIREKKNVLTVLNTTKDSYDVVNSIEGAISTFTDRDMYRVFLLNKKRTSRSNMKDIDEIKSLIKNNPELIVIAICTQLVEAGVDIDFPVVYSAMSPFSSLIQRGGRCNRNGKIDFGRLIIFEFYRETERGIYNSSEWVYDKDILDASRKLIPKISCEIDFFKSQKEYFSILHEKYLWGGVKINELNTSITKLYNELKLGDIGNVSLIKEFSEDRDGEVVTYYIKKNKLDENFENLMKLEQRAIEIEKDPTLKDRLRAILMNKSEITRVIRRMSSGTVSITFKDDEERYPVVYGFPVRGMYLLEDGIYNEKTGLNS